MILPVQRRRCAHDRRDFSRFVPVGVDPRTHKRTKLRMLEKCPHKALPDSDYCMPHSVLHGETHERTLTYICDAITLYRQGLLIIPPSINGEMVLPAWWPVRFN